MIAVVSPVFSIARDTKMQQEREKSKRDEDGRGWQSRKPLPLLFQVCMYTSGLLNVL
jgi:hypothetical protein